MRGSFTISYSLDASKCRYHHSDYCMCHRDDDIMPYAGICFYRTVLVKYLASHERSGISSSKPSTDRIKGDTILLMLLRLRQCCSHPDLTNEVFVLQSYSNRWEFYKLLHQFFVKLK